MGVQQRAACRAERAEGEVPHDHHPPPPAAPPPGTPPASHTTTPLPRRLRRRGLPPLRGGRRFR